jgi:hypothetical protein
LLLTFCFSCKNNTEEQYKEAETNFKLSSFDWMRGSWKIEMTKDSLNFNESWLTDSNGNWAGKSVQVFGKDTVKETMTIYKVENRIYYTVKIDGQNQGVTSHFLLKDTANQTFVFSDDERSFPQVVMYKPISANSFEATLKGIKGGKPTTIVHNFVRVN